MLKHVVVPGFQVVFNTQSVFIIGNFRSVRFRTTSLTGSFQFRLSLSTPSRSVIPENITRGQNEEGSPLEMDAWTQQHVESETLNSIPELSANCQGPLLLVHGQVLPLLMALALSRSPLKRERKSRNSECLTGILKRSLRAPRNSFLLLQIFPLTQQLMDSNLEKHLWQPISEQNAMNWILDAAGQSRGPW